MRRKYPSIRCGIPHNNKRKSPLTSCAWSEVKALRLHSREMEWEQHSCWEYHHEGCSLRCSLHCASLEDTSVLIVYFPSKVKKLRVTLYCLNGELHKRPLASKQKISTSGPNLPGMQSGQRGSQECFRKQPCV